MRPRLRGMTARRTDGEQWRRATAVALAMLLVASMLAGRWQDSAMSAVAQQQDGVADMLIVLDVTRSMAGAEGSRDIWEPIRTKAEEIVDTATPGTRLAIVPFADGPQWARIHPGPVPENGEIAPLIVRSAAEREAAKAHLRSLTPDGRATYIHSSLRFALQQLARWRAGQPSRPQTLVLFTDGDDTHPTESALGLEGICAQFANARAANPQLSTLFIDLTGKSCGAEPTIVVAPDIINLQTQKLDFGDLAAAPSGAEREIVLSATQQIVWTRGHRVQLRLEAAGPGPAPRLQPSEVGLSEKFTVTLFANGTPPGPGQGKLILTIVSPSEPTALLLPHSSVDVLWSVPEPTATHTATPVPTETPLPTATPAPTDTPAPTVTPIPTATPAPTLTPVPTDTVRPTPTTVPSATPVPPTPIPPTPQIVVSLDGPSDHLGAITAGADAPLDGARGIRAEFDGPSRQLGARLGLTVAPGAYTRADTTGLVGPGGGLVSVTELTADAATATLRFQLLAPRCGFSWPGMLRHELLVTLAATPGAVQVLNTQRQPIDQLALSFDVQCPWDERHWWLLAAILALLLLLLFILSRPRIPGDLRIFLNGVSRTRVRDLPPPRWINGQIAIGGAGGNLLIPDVPRRICRVRPNWNCFRGIPARPGSKLWVRPEAGVTIRNGGLELEAGRWTPFYPHDDLVITVPPANRALPTIIVRLSFRLPA